MKLALVPAGVAAARRPAVASPSILVACDFCDAVPLDQPACVSDFMQGAFARRAAQAGLGSYAATTAPPRPPVDGGLAVTDLLAQAFYASAYTRPAVNGGSAVSDFTAPAFHAAAYVRPAIAGGAAVSSFLTQSFFARPA